MFCQNYKFAGDQCGALRELREAISRSPQTQMWQRCRDWQLRHRNKVDQPCEISQHITYLGISAIPTWRRTKKNALTILRLWKNYVLKTFPFPTAPSIVV